tara:strand:+ start:247 stop:1935 length:1689 start_codon:yes stop_codon:yes gene_type:complete
MSKTNPYLDNKYALLIWAKISIIFVIVYLRFVLYGGFSPYDHLYYINESQHKDFLVYLGIELSGASSARPIFGLILFTIISLFKFNPWPYIIFLFLLWFSTVAILFHLIKSIVSRNAAFVFALLALFPIFSSTIVFDHYIAASYVFSVLLWSLSLSCLHNHVNSNNLNSYIFAYIILVFALLTIEILLPLLSITAILPIILHIDKNRITFKKNDHRLILKYVLPVIIIASVFFVFKVFVTPLYTGGSVWGTRPIDLKSFEFVLYYFYVVVVEIPLMMLEIVPRLFDWEILEASVFIIAFYVLLRKKLLKNDVVGSVERCWFSKENMFIGLVVFSLFSCAVIFFISHRIPQTYGTLNRLMLPSFILLSILLAWLFEKMVITKWFFLPVVISVLWVSSMIVQIDGFIESWETRKSIYNDMAMKLNSVELGNDPILIACVPFYNKSNYNNESVFTKHNWSHQVGLRLFGANTIPRILSVNWNYINIYRDFSVIDDYVQYSYQLPIPTYSNFWYYEYDQEAKLSQFERIADKEELAKKISHITENRINYHPVILREKIRLKLGQLF